MNKEKPGEFSPSQSSVGTLQQNPPSSKTEERIAQLRRVDADSISRPRLGRHAAKCRICTHSQRQDIEEDFVAWKSPGRIAKEYQLGNRSCVYRHARAANLDKQRQRNVRAALERIIEQAGDVEATASSIVAAVSVYVDLNARGEWVEADQRVYLDELFERMSADEYATYAQEGALPRWFHDALAAVGARANGNKHE